MSAFGDVIHWFFEGVVACLTTPVDLEGSMPLLVLLIEERLLTKAYKVKKFLCALIILEYKVNQFIKVARHYG